MSFIRHRLLQGLKVGDTFSVSRTFTAQEVEQFEELSRDHNPVHSHVSFAASKGFDRCIAHGLLVASMLTEIGGELAWLASEMVLRFRKPTYSGDTITCELTLLDLDSRGKATAEAIFINQDGQRVLEATLKGYLPSQVELDLLR